MREISIMAIFDVENVKNVFNNCFFPIIENFEIIGKLHQNAGKMSQ